MNLFTFDKYWELDWNHIEGSLYGCNYFGFYIVADKTKVSNPKFTIYTTKSLEKSLHREIDSDWLIIYMKKIKSNES